MPGKPLAAGICMFVLAVSGIHATGVSFLVLETGLPLDSAASQYSTMWENGLLEVFFDSGHIVSNASRIRLLDGVSTEGLPPEAEKDYEDARIGGMDYFLVAIVDHPSHNVSLRLFSTRSRDLLAEKAHEGGIAINSREEHESIRRTAWAMAAFLR